MADSLKIELPKPKILAKIVLTHNQTMEILTDRYTEDELDKILDNVNGPIRFWGCDENGKAARVTIMRPSDMLGYILLDYESIASIMRRAQMAAPLNSGPRR